MEITAKAVVEAFDEILDYVYGRSRGRDWHHKDDLKTAQEWIDKGLTLPIACVVFHHRMVIMHEAWLRRPPNDREAVPHSLKFCSEHIDTAIRRSKRGGDFSQWEQTEMQWRNRIKAWLKGHSWYENLWGAVPGDPYCRVPKSLIRELVPAVLPDGIGRKKNAGGK